MLLAAFGHVARGGGDGLEFLFTLLFLTLVGGLGWWLIRRRRGGPEARRVASPLQTLQERFARGEIDRDEFEHRKAVLVGADVVPPAPGWSTGADVPDPTAGSTPGSAPGSGPGSAPDAGPDPAGGDGGDDRPL